MAGNRTASTASSTHITRDFLLLSAAFLVVLGVWSFFELAEAVGEEVLLQLDERILLALREPGELSNPIGPRWFEEAMRDLSALGSTMTIGLVAAAVAGHLLLSRNVHALGFVIVSVSGGMALSSVLKHFFDRPRPELVPALTYVASPSFPSGHAMLAAVFYLTLGALLARLVLPLNERIYVLIIALLLTSLVGVSRVYLGVHYPTDVLAGWLAGLAWAMFCWLVMRVLQRRGQVESPRNPPARDES